MPGLSYSLVSRTGLARTVAAIDGRPEVTVPTACTNGHTVDLEVTIYVRTGRRLQTSTDALRPAGRSQGERTDMAEQSARCGAVGRWQPRTNQHVRTPRPHCVCVSR